MRIEALGRRWVIEWAPFSPGWLRRWVPWWLLIRLTRRWRLCWAQVVTWRMYSDEVHLSISPYCWSGRPGEEYDYCGRYETLEAFEEALRR